MSVVAGILRMLAALTYTLTVLLAAVVASWATRRHVQASAATSKEPVLQVIASRVHQADHRNTRIK